MSSADTVRQVLDDFMDHTMKSYPELEVAFDPDWRSPCEIGQPYERDGEERITWRPLARHRDTIGEDFAPLERALEITVHPDIKAYYGAFWSAGLEAEAAEGHVSLLFLWNNEDIERLNENLIGHAMAKQRARCPMSIFFACTEPESELFLTVDNDSGTVLLEKPGFKPIREVAPDLATFLAALVPRPPIIHR